eukprot:6212048-Pleurochrysis_carterae.AAC.1
MALIVMPHRVDVCCRKAPAGDALKENRAPCLDAGTRKQANALGHEYHAPWSMHMQDAYP